MGPPWEIGPTTHCTHNGLKYKNSPKELKVPRGEDPTVITVIMGSEKW